MPDSTKKRSNTILPKNRLDARIEFYNALSEGKLDLRSCLKMMRKIAKKTQKEYAEMIGIAPRIIIDLERGVGNPTLKTLEKIGKPFGLTVMLMKKNSSASF